MSRSVELSHPDKVLFPDVGVTKAELADYYRRVAPLMLPHLRGRPISMQRFPAGIGKRGFFHKDIPDYFPAWFERAEMKKSGGSVTHPIVTSADSLVYLANQNTITPHVWLSRSDKPQRPDRLVIDLDPSRDDFAEVRRAARDIGGLLEELGLPRFAMVTGSRGVHIWVPIRRDRDQKDARAFAGGSRVSPRSAGRNDSPQHFVRRSATKRSSLTSPGTGTRRPSFLPTASGPGRALRSRCRSSGVSCPTRS